MLSLVTLPTSPRGRYIYLVEHQRFDEEIAHEGHRDRIDHHGSDCRAATAGHVAGGPGHPEALSAGDDRAVLVSHGPARRDLPDERRVARAGHGGGPRAAARDGRLRDVPAHAGRA